jgi:3-oxoacyl-[acyl-carrier-protein] synthase II
MVRVVVTGFGVISPVGNSVEKTWRNLLAGKSGIDFITNFDTENFLTKIAGEIKNFNPTEHGLDAKEARRMDRYSQYATAATEEALKDSRLDLSVLDPTRVGVALGVGYGGIMTFEAEHQKMIKKGPKRISPFMIPMMIANIGAGNISIKYGLKGPQFCPVAACASGTYGIIDGFRAIKDGIADVMVAGGAEAAVSPLCVGGFNSMKALSTANDEPSKASRPFDKERTGFVPGEGSGIMILERLDHAKKRGATIYAEVVGFGLSSDANHITQPAPGGEGGYRAMKMAIDIAGIQSDEIDYINAHGTSTPYNDKMETVAIKTLFGDHARDIKINSTKSMTGHLLGGSGGLEGVVTALSIHHQKLHPTINCENFDPDCDLDYVRDGAEDFPIRYALSNSFGFGGINGVVAFGRYAQ